MVNISKRINKTIERIIEILVIILGIYLAYQIILFIIGKTWTVENLIISLLIFNLGAIFTIGLILATLRSDYKHLTAQFRSLANDFKEHIKHK